MTTEGALSTTYHHFDVQDRDGCLHSAQPVPATQTPQWAKAVSAKRFPWSIPSQAPLFLPPIPFVNPPEPGGQDPFHTHNHCPAITWLPNGDLLTAWFSTQQEWGLEMTILASRLRVGAAQWDPSSEFFKASERNMTGTALFHDGRGTLYHFNGMGPHNTHGWENLVLLLRTSTDNGVTWTPPRAIAAGGRYQRRHQVIAGTSVTPAGVLLQPCDAIPGEGGPSAVHISQDNGQTWSDPGGEVRGIHAGVVGLRDGRLLAFGRGQPIDGCMPISTSPDLARTWTYRASPFPPISSAQRLILMRLREGPLLLVSFTYACHKVPPEEWKGMTFTDPQGESFTGHGMFAALSYDEGDSWPVRKLLTPGSGTYNGGGWTRTFTATPDIAESKGYLAATQTPDHVIHLVSSGLHYRFNLAFLDP